MTFVDENGVAKVQEGESGVKKRRGVAQAISVCPPTLYPSHVLPVT